MVRPVRSIAQESAVNGAAVVAVDVGGTSIKAACFTDVGDVLDERTVPTPVGDGPGAVVAEIGAVARELARPGTAAVGVVVPGLVEDGVARYSTNLGWRDVPLREELHAALGVPVTVEHDVHAAGYAECVIGRARDARDALVVVLGTGIAAVVVAGGKPVRGARGMAGELGHLPVYPDGEPCACGQRGCTEVYASAAGIARRYLARTGVACSAEQLAAALGTDAEAAAVWAEAADALGLALASATLLLDPASVVLGGGLAGAGEALRAPVAEALGARLAWRPSPDVVLSPLAGRAGLYGAALLAWQAAGRDVGGTWPLL
jgi:glucokinase